MREIDGKKRKELAGVYISYILFSWVAVERLGNMERDMARMKSVDLGSVEASNESIAVARGKAVISAIEGVSAVLLDTDDTDGDEAVWSELTSYLARRGVTVAYDHDAGYPVARSEVV